MQQGRLITGRDWAGFFTTYVPMYYVISAFSLYFVCGILSETFLLSPNPSGPRQAGAARGQKNSGFFGFLGILQYAAAM
jgi:hypothetical protein